MKNLLTLAVVLSAGVYIGGQMKISEKTGKEVEYNNGMLKISSDSLKVYDHKVFEIKDGGLNLFETIRLTQISKSE